MDNGKGVQHVSQKIRERNIVIIIILTKLISIIIPVASGMHKNKLDAVICLMNIFYWFVRPYQHANGRAIVII